MDTKSFLQTLHTHPDAELCFIHGETTVPRHFHITEVKRVDIHSVDCGGRPDNYEQTVVQLWLPPTENAQARFNASKAAKIFSQVNEVVSLSDAAEVFVEWGDAEAPTSHYAIKDIVSSDERLTVSLWVPPTTCKPAAEQLGQGCCGPTTTQQDSPCCR